MPLADVVALIMLAALTAYVLFGGADFGAGLWTLLASGPRRREQRHLIETVIAPVWEVNHVWLILVIVMLFTGFPTAFSTAMTALHVPLTVMLIGVVLRGAGFSFLQYDDRRDEVQRRWGRMFSVASTVTPVSLGVCLGAITAGGIHVDGGRVRGGLSAWLGAFPLACAALAVAAFAYLAAVYLTVETDDPDLRDDFRARAIAAGVVTAACALLCALAAAARAPRFWHALTGSGFSAPLAAIAVAAAAGGLASLGRRWFGLARVLAIAEVATIVVGWGLAQAPYLVAPDVTITGAAAPSATLVLMLAGIGAGAVLLVPSLVWLLRVFRTRPRGAAFERRDDL